MSVILPERTTCDNVIDLQDRYFAQKAWRCGMTHKHNKRLLMPCALAAGSGSGSRLLPAVVWHCALFTQPQYLPVASEEASSRYTFSLRQIKFTAHDNRRDRIFEVLDRNRTLSNTYSRIRQMVRTRLEFVPEPITTPCNLALTNKVARKPTAVDPNRERTCAGV